MQNELELSFSDDALLTRVFFLTSTTQFNIFVEDTNKQYEYEELFERLLPKEIKVDNIISMGGKLNLEKAFHLFGTSTDYGKTIFIADGDFDIALGRQQIVANNFIYLERYNIESYLLHKDSVLRYMRPKLKKTLIETTNIVEYDNWLACVAPFLQKLFALHFIVQKCCSNVQNVSRGYDRFFTCKGFPDETEFNKYKNEIGQSISNIDSKINESLTNLKKLYGCHYASFVCGKYYIGGLKRFLNKYLKKKINDEELKAVLIAGFDVAELEYVKNKILSYVVA